MEGAVRMTRTRRRKSGEKGEKAEGDGGEEEEREEEEEGEEQWMKQCHGGGDCGEYYDWHSWMDFHWWYYDDCCCCYRCSGGDCDCDGEEEGVSCRAVICSVAMGAGGDEGVEIEGEGDGSEKSGRSDENDETENGETESVDGGSCWAVVGIGQARVAVEWTRD